MRTSKWSSLAWALHDLGLAIAVGGTVFGKLALHPAVRRIEDPQERDEVVDAAWSRFQVVNLAAHGVVATTWLVGRELLSGREAGGAARSLAIVKDSLIAASLASGIACTVLERALARRIARREGPAQEAPGKHTDGSRRLERAVGVLGSANLAANAGVIGVTSLLAMQAGRSGRFALTSRMLP